MGILSSNSKSYLEFWVLTVNLELELKVLFKFGILTSEFWVQTNSEFMQRIIRSISEFSVQIQIFEFSRRDYEFKDRILSSNLESKLKFWIELWEIPFQT